MILQQRQCAKRGNLFVNGVRHGEGGCGYDEHDTYVCPGCEQKTCWCCGTSETAFCDVCSVLMKEQR